MPYVVNGKVAFVIFLVLHAPIINVDYISTCVRSAQV